MNTQASSVSSSVDATKFRLSKKRKQMQKKKKTENFKKLKLQYEECTKKLERITNCSRK